MYPKHHGRALWQACVYVQKQSEQLVNSFEAPLKEFVRAVKSAKSVISDRSTALALLQQVLLTSCPRLTSAGVAHFLFPGLAGRPARKNAACRKLDQLLSISH